MACLKSATGTNTLKSRPLPWEMTPANSGSPSLESCITGPPEAPFIAAQLLSLLPVTAACRVMEQAGS